MIRPDDDLLDRALDGMLDEGEERALAQRLKTEPALARRMMELARDEALFADSASSARALTSETARRIPTPAVAAAAAILLSALLWNLLPSARPEVEVAETGGTCLVGGNRVKTGTDGKALLRFADGSTIRLSPSTEVSFAKTGRVHVVAGEIAAAVAPRRSGTEFLVTTSHAEARVVGTRFTVVATESSTRLIVDEGKVLFGRGKSQPIPVTAGQFATADAGSLPGGLLGEYFAGPDFKEARLSRIDPQIEFHWDSATPHPLIPPESFSVRWTGRIVARNTETYTFHALTDDGLRLWVNGARVIDHWAQSTKTERTGTAALKAWEPAEFRMEYMNVGGPATAVLSWSSPATPKAAIPPNAFHPAPLEGSGLKGEYFDEMDLTVPKFTRIDPIVDYDWGLGAPQRSMDPDTFSVRWTGFVVPSHSERYTFHTESDDGVRLWIDGALVIDDWTIRGTAERSGVITLEAGRRHAIRLEYFDRISTARVKLSWTSPSQPREVIPQSRLYP